VAAFSALSRLVARRRADMGRVKPAQDAALNNLRIRSGDRRRLRPAAWAGGGGGALGILNPARRPGFCGLCDPDEEKQLDGCLWQACCGLLLTTLFIIANLEIVVVPQAGICPTICDRVEMPDRKIRALGRASWIVGNHRA